MNDFNLTITSRNENFWEQRKPSDYLKESKIPGGNGEGTKKLTVKLWGKGVTKKKTIYQGSSNTQYYIRKSGQLIYGKLDFLHAAFGLVPKELDGYESTIDSPSFDVLHGDSEFLLNYFLRKDFYLKNGQRANGSRKAKRINQKTFLNMIIYCPSQMEQSKISGILSKINRLITLYERKTRLLGKVRTFLTQRLFSNSSKVSLYFDNKNWSEHKISEFLTERNEKVVPNSSIPLVSFTVEKGVTPKSKRYNREFLVKDDNKKYKITKKDDIVYNPANLKFGAIARNKFGNAAFSPIYVTFITKLNPAFTEFLVRRKNFINLALKYQEGTVYERMAVKSKDFLNLKIYLPNSSRDINHIAQILQSLDTLVSLNKNKVSLITLIKKELLNTMFI